MEAVTMNWVLKIDAFILITVNSYPHAFMHILRYEDGEFQKLLRKIYPKSLHPCRGCILCLAILDPVTP